ncbi:hypothetical protein BH10PSE19_BH10PSE19_01970 [soil metagenome]
MQLLCYYLSNQFGEKIMAHAIKISDELVTKARIHAKALHRSMASQIEHWAKIGQIAEENPELSYTFIRDIMLAIEEVKAEQVEPYIFGEGETH